MTPQNLPTPVLLSYIASLRGVLPRQPGQPFTYALAHCEDPQALLCLAASNPEGQFFGVMKSDDLCRGANDLSAEREVTNCLFVTQGSTLPPLNYLCLDDRQGRVSANERAAFFVLAAACVAGGGLLHISYPAYDDEHGALRFLVREFGPEMNPEQAKEFLDELKALGKSYFKGHSLAASRLDQAIKLGMPDEFFMDYDAGPARSASFDTLVALRPRGFVYAGDTDVASNYLDLAIDREAQEIALKCASNYLYEPIKDFTLNRMLRSDIWFREPAPKSSDLSKLFGGFAFGIVGEAENVPRSVDAGTQKIDLSSPLFEKLIKMMTLMPVTIGDFLSTDDGKGEKPSDVIGAIHVLVALGIAQPMRGQHSATRFHNVTQPRFALPFNRHLGQSELTSEPMHLASPVLGGAMRIDAREALVMQALDRGGLANSVSALLPELQRLAHNPKGLTVANDGDPTEESARSLIEDTVSKGIVHWYAYGLLEAA